MKFAYLSALLVSTVYACGHVVRQADGNFTLPFNYTQGNDPPADPATKSYFSNHMSLIVSNLTATRQWYSDVLGMRHIFTFDLSPNYSLMYMGHSQGGKNGTGYQTGLEMTRDKNNMAGLIEFVWYKKAANRTFVPNAQTTLSHMGLIVDDLAVAEKRFESMGVTIVKKSGSLDFSAETGNRALAGAYGFDNLDDEETQKDIAAVLPGLKAIGFLDFVFLIADPDGNLFEVMPQDSPAA